MAHLSRISFSAPISESFEVSNPAKIVQCPDSTTTHQSKLQITLQNAISHSTAQLSIEMSHRPYHKIWVINKVSAKINNTIDYDFRTADLYADEGNSYSCSALRLSGNSNGTHADLVLHDFQIQPFGEGKETVFAQSQDCSVWITEPVLMGFLVILLGVVVVLLGTSFLAQISSSDLKFSKQGGILMNQAQLDATKG